MNNPFEVQSAFDFYISASQKSAAAQEVAQVLRENGYYVYVPVRNNKEAEVDRIAANCSKAIVLILTKDGEQTQIDLNELLNMLPIGDYERRVIIFEFEECGLSGSLDRNLITTLVGLNRHDRTLRILASAAQSPQKALPTKADRIPTLDPIAQREETSRQSDWRSPDPQEVPAISADTKKLKIGHIRRLSPVFPLPAPAVRRKSLTDAAASRSVKASRTIREISPFEDEEAALSIRQKASDEADIIEFGVGHPTNVTIGVAFVVDVLIYRQDDRSVAEERAATLRPENDGFGFAGATKVGRGTKLTVMLELPWPTEPKIQSVYWSGSITNVSFRVAPTNLAQASVYGICTF